MRHEGRGTASHGCGDDGARRLRSARCDRRMRAKSHWAQMPRVGVTCRIENELPTVVPLQRWRSERSDRRPPSCFRHPQCASSVGSFLHRYLNFMVLWVLRRAPRGSNDHTRPCPWRAQVNPVSDPQTRGRLIASLGRPDRFFPSMSERSNRQHRCSRLLCRRWNCFAGPIGTQDPAPNVHFPAHSRWRTTCRATGRCTCSGPSFTTEAKSASLQI